MVRSPLSELCHEQNDSNQCDARSDKNIFGKCDEESFLTKFQKEATFSQFLKSFETTSHLMENDYWDKTCHITLLLISFIIATISL